jgi:3-oxoacyl-[acyl-carrier-protein] synthase-1
MSTLAVRGCGMVSALGFNAASTLAALRARVSAVQALPWMDFESGEPLRGAKVPLPQWWEGAGKLVDLVAPAVQECLQIAAPNQPATIPILLAVSEPGRPGRPEGLESEIFSGLHAKLGLSPNRHSRAYAAGQTGCARAMVDAHRLIASGMASMCVVAGVDSYLQQEALDEYIERRRLMTSSNSNGFFPGEGGSAVLVAAAGDTRVEELQIRGFGLAQESATIESTEPLRALGLTQAMRQALKSAGIPMTAVPRRITDLSGEQYGFKEALFAIMRTNTGPRPVTPEMEHPIEYLGHVGAAILPILLAWAWHGQRNGYFEPDPLLIHTGADSGERAALVVQRVAPVRSRS